MGFLIHPTVLPIILALSIDITLGKVNLTRLLPPGPHGNPILCHLRLIPRDHPEGAFTLWGEQYKADILCLNVLYRLIIVLNSIEAALDLLDKRGSAVCCLLGDGLGSHTHLPSLQTPPKSLPAVILPICM